MDVDIVLIRKRRRQQYDKWRWAKYYWENRDYERERALKNYYRRKEERLRNAQPRENQFEHDPIPTVSEDI